MMFGPPDASSPNSAQSMRWRIKRDSNDTLRQKFVDATIAQAEAIGLTVPDAELQWNPTKNDGAGGYDFGTPDWDEFYAVVRGEGPTAVERISERRHAWEDGAGVRDAAMAHAHKQAARAAETETRAKVA